MLTARGGVEIRERRVEDLAGCVDGLAETHRGGYPSNWPVDPEGWLTPTGLLAAWVAVDVGEVLGHVLARSAGPGRAELGRLFVTPGARGQGLASALIGQVQRWAKDRDLHLMLEVNDELRAAVAIYERLGWRRTSTQLADWTAQDGNPVTLHTYAGPST